MQENKNSQYGGTLQRVYVPANSKPYYKRLSSNSETKIYIFLRRAKKELGII